MKIFVGWLLAWMLSGTVVLLTNGCVGQNDTLPNQDEVGEGLRVAGREICQEVRSGKMWQRSRSRLIPSLQDAEQYALTLKLGGYDDWRLPTREELFDLHYIFFWEKNGNCLMNRKGSFWSVSEEEHPFPGYWETYFLCNPEYRYVQSKRTRGYVRAVRP